MSLVRLRFDWSGHIGAVILLLLQRWGPCELGVEIGGCLDYWQRIRQSDGSPLLDRQLGRCLERQEVWGASSFGVMDALLLMRPFVMDVLIFVKRDDSDAARCCENKTEHYRRNIRNIMSDVPTKALGLMNIRVPRFHCQWFDDSGLSILARASKWWWTLVCRMCVHLLFWVTLRMSGIFWTRDGTPPFELDPLPHAICMQIAWKCNSSSRGPSTTKSKDIGGMGMSDVHKKFGKNFGSLVCIWCVVVLG